MSEMIERVAKALCCPAGYCAEAGQRYDPINGPVRVCAAHSFRDNAKAAIKAMREPTDAMTKKSVDFALGVSLSGDYRWPDYMIDLHRLNIDAALAEHPAA